MLSENLSKRLSHIVLHRQLHQCDPFSYKTRTLIYILGCFCVWGGGLARRGVETNSHYVALAGLKLAV